MATARKITIKPRRQDVPRFGDVAQQLVTSGYKPVPLHFGKKNPTPRNWTGYVFDPKHVRGGKFSQHRDDGTGILTGEVVALDIDVREPKATAEIEAAAEFLLGEPPRRIGAAPKVLRIYRTDSPFSKLNSVEVSLPDDLSGAKKHKVEVLGLGQQFVAYNVHPDTGKPYVWNGAGDPLSVPVAELVTVTEAQMRSFIGRCDQILSARATIAPGDLAEDLRRDADAQVAALNGKQLVAKNPDECRAALGAIPNENVSYDRYIDVGLAIAGAFGADGREDFHEWASKSAKYDVKKTESDWQGFMKNPPRSRGAGSIFFDAKAAGWKPDAEKPAPADDAIEIESLTDDWLTEEPPEQDWLWQDWAPLGSVTGVTAEGGAGK